MTKALVLENAPRLILASASQGRAQILRDVGLDFEIRPADIDESAVRQALAVKDSEVEAADVAEILARTKAERISAENPDALVIGADQVLSLEGKIFEKPKDMNEARETLFELSGKSHTLHAAISVAEQGNTVWHVTDHAVLTMRVLSPEFVGRYLAAAGDRVCQSVGAYQIESFGLHLFDTIEGDYFTILGLPLLPLLRVLRERKIIYT